MKTLIAILLFAWGAAAADSYFLITYTLGPGVNILSLTPEQSGELAGHAQHATKLMASGSLVAGGHTTDPTNVTGIAIVSAKDAAAARAMGEDRAVKKGILKMVVQPFMLLKPEAPLAAAPR